MAILVYLGFALADDFGGKCLSEDVGSCLLQTSHFMGRLEEAREDETGDVVWSTGDDFVERQDQCVPAIESARCAELYLVIKLP